MRIFFYVFICLNLYILRVESYPQNLGRHTLSMDTVWVHNKIDLYNSVKLQSPVEAKKILDTALYISYRLNYTKGAGKIYKEYAWHYISMGDYEKAEKYLKQAKQIFSNFDISPDLARTIVIEGILQAEQALYPAALTQFSEAQKIYIALRDTENVATIDNNLGKLYYLSGDTSQSLFYFKRALVYNTHKNNIAGLLSNYSGISALYNSKKDVKNAIIVGRKMLKTAIESNSKYHEAVAHHNIGTAYHTSNTRDSSLKNWKRAAMIYEELGAENDLASVQLNIANQIKKKQLREAINLVQRSIEISEKKRNKHILQQCYLLLKELYELADSHKTALKYANLYITLKDSLTGENMRKEIWQIEKKYEAEKHEAEKNTLLQINENSQLRIKNHRNLIIGILLIGTSTLIALFLTLINIKNTSKTKNLKIRQKLLVSQLNPHFVFNSLNSIQNFIYKNKPLYAAKYLNGFADLMRMILVTSRKDYISLTEEKRFLETYLGIQKMRFEDKLQYSIQIDSKIDIDTTLVPPMLAQPFLENSIEHGLFKSSNQGQISILYKKKNSYLILEVEDNGIGLQPQTNEGIHESLAIKITSERISVLKTLFGKNTTFEIINKEDLGKGDHGVKVVFKIPFKTEI